MTIGPACELKVKRRRQVKYGGEYPPHFGIVLYKGVKVIIGQVVASLVAVGESIKG